MTIEVDKALLEGRERRLQDALLIMIDSETNGSVPDEWLSTVVDMSNVSWVFTANDTRGLSSPLLDRVRVLAVPAPEVEHLPMIVQGVLKDLAETYRIPPDELPSLPPETLQELLRMYRSGASIRKIKRAITAAIGASMRGFPAH